MTACRSSIKTIVWNYYPFYYFVFSLKGQVKISCDDSSSIELTPGGYLNIPAYKKTGWNIPMLRKKKLARYSLQ